MKRTTRIILACILLVGIVAALAACNENTKQKAVQTTYGGAVKDNGGMAVQYGDYIYFVNGYAGESALNTFGKVVRGAICRVTLTDGEPDYTTLKVIVPKNVFGEDTTHGGIYIVNDYLYYNTPSVDKNSKLEYKSSEGTLCRTSLDGSKTEVLKKLGDNDAILYAGDNSNYLVYSYDNYLYSLDAKGNETILTKPTAKKTDLDKQTYVSLTCAGDYAFYTMYNYANETASTSDYLVYVYDLKNGGTPTLLMSSDIYRGNDSDVLYTTSLVNAQMTENGFILFYSKTGNDTGIGNGFYSCAFTAENPAFNKENEVRYTFDTSTNAYSQFKLLANDTVLAFASDHIDVFDATDDCTKVIDPNNDLPLRYAFSKDDSATTVTLIDFVETDTEVSAFYLYDSKFRYIKLFNIENEEYLVARENAVAFFAGKYNSSYVTYDVIDNVIYYLNDDMEDNAYYYVIPAFDTIVVGETDISTGKILGKISKEDLTTLIADAQ